MKLDFDIETKSPKLEFDMKDTRVVSTGGGISENRVQQIVEEKTKDLQPKTDETLETNSKQIVGAINEVNKKAGQVGSQGKDGVGVEKVEQTVISTDDKGENIITITLTNGEEYTFTVLNGSKGSQGERGADGYTPVKYKDYFTEADISEMVQAVISALPKYNGEVIEI